MGALGSWPTFPILCSTSGNTTILLPLAQYRSCFFSGYASPRTAVILASMGPWSSLVASELCGVAVCPGTSSGFAMIVNAHVLHLAWPLSALDSFTPISTVCPFAMFWMVGRGVPLVVAFLYRRATVEKEESVHLRVTLSFVVHGG